jgi:protein-tyrosine-phosphatase
MDGDAAMAEPAFNVLFLCTGNSARSILAETLLNELGKGRFRAYSAGSRPAGRVNPLALELLEKNRFSTGELRSKSWDEFAQPDAPHFDFVITVCDNAAGEVCPVWPGQPMTAHWGIPDPAAVEGSDEAKRHAFVEAMSQLQRRLSAFVSLPFHTLDGMRLQQAVREIGKTACASTPMRNIQ